MPRSQTERLWMVAGGLVALAMLLLGYFLFIGPQGAETDDVDEQVAVANSRNSLLQSKVDALAAQNKELPKYLAAAKQARLALPDTSGLADFLRTLQSIGNGSGSDVASLTVGAPKDVSSVLTAPAGTPAAPAGTPVAGTPQAPVASKAAGAATVYALPITAQVNGSVKALNDFLTQLQSVQPRAVLVSQIAETDGAVATTSGGKAAARTSISLTMYAFVAPGTAAEAAKLSSASGK